MGKNILKFINYTKEAFYWPLHLVTFGILGLATTATAIAGSSFFGLDPAGLFFIFGGLELMSLGMVTRSRRFRRAINAKYGKELNTYAYLKILAESYNKLSAQSQRRFEELRLLVNEAKNNYSKLNSAFPDLVKDYMRKIDALQINFVKLLVTYEHFPDTIRHNDPEKLRGLIEEIRTGMGDDSPRLRGIKEKRIKLLQQRIQNFNESNNNYHVLDQQLQTIEEMVKFFVEQPLASNKMEDIATIEHLLEETNDLHNTLDDIDEIMRSDLTTTTTTEVNSLTGSGEQNIYAD